MTLDRFHWGLVLNNVSIVKDYLIITLWLAHLHVNNIHLDISFDLTESEGL